MDMLREAAKKHTLGINKEFRHRGEEPGRLENFSDAIFALAITLLLISTSPPSNFEQIKRFLYDLVPFFLCIILFLLIWFEHFKFFYRYGLRNARIVVLNSLFLFLVLFYVYPLKFLTRLIEIPMAMLFNNEALLHDLKGLISPADMGDLMVIYGLGASAVFCVLALMYQYALKHAAELDLNEIEVFDTRTSMRTNLLMGSVPLMSVLVALIFSSHWMAGMLSGFTYFLYTPIMLIHGTRVEKKRRLIVEAHSMASKDTTTY